ncbi:lytic transglycosylase domain-containing protein [Nocardia sp. BMG51109]|uniref:lytic transglycosylase domain-containing protein n=1 Tax=Nocardia sp. BMG51109 TaxID=1056816 RepID=UPI0004B7FE19|nr:lytic murein transglycosylase [Nocardia sp. BMG51109]
MASGSTAHSPVRTSAPKAADAQLTASTAAADPASAPADQTAGLVPAAPEQPRRLRAMTPPADGAPPFAGTVPLRDIALPGGGALGIPEVVLAAYRNAELAMQSSAPACGVSWHLLAGIGRIESGHARNGHTDAAGTTVGTIYGPSLDGTLPGNEIIKAADGGFVRAVGPMQFLPGTWSHYATDGNGDGVSDPNNVFDATLGAAKYLCSGGLDLRDPQQELRSVLRYNNSLSYAATVLSWSRAYQTGGSPTQVTISPDLIPPGSMQAPSGPDIVAVNSTYPGASAAPPPPETAAATVQPPTEVQTQTQAVPPTQVMINIPGLPPIPCGIFCPPPPPQPCGPAAVPAPMPMPMQPGAPVGQPWAPGDPARAAGNPDPRAAQPNPAACGQPQAQPGQPPAPAPVAPAPAPEAAAPEQQQAEAPAPEPAPAEPTQQATQAPPPAPAITLPFGITIPLPPPPA